MTVVFDHQILIGVTVRISAQVFLIENSDPDDPATTDKAAIEEATCITAGVNYGENMYAWIALSEEKEIEAIAIKKAREGDEGDVDEWYDESDPYDGPEYFGNPIGF